MRCSKDDLAFTVAHYQKENAHKLVRCVRLWNGEELNGIRFSAMHKLNAQGEPHWVIESLGSPFVNLKDHTQTTMMVPWPDRLLRPLRGAPEPEAIEKTNFVKDQS
jgi:hypothetical protein